MRTNIAVPIFLSTSFGYREKRSSAPVAALQHYEFWITLHTCTEVVLCLCFGWTGQLLPICELHSRECTCIITTNRSADCKLTERTHSMVEASCAQRKHCLWARMIPNFLMYMWGGWEGYQLTDSSKNGYHTDIQSCDVVNCKITWHSEFWWKVKT